MPQPLNRTQKRQKQTKEKIFRAAMALFRQKGFDHTTVADITEAADIGKGTFFTYFPTKDAVFGQLGEMMLETMTAEAEKEIRAGRTLAEVLIATLTASAGWLELNKPVASQLIRSAYALNADTPNQTRLLSLLADLLRVGQERGEIKKTVNPDDAALCLAGSYFAAIAVWMVADRPPIRERLLGAIKVILEGVSC